MHHIKYYYCKYMCVTTSHNQKTTGTSTDELMPTASSVESLNILGIIVICVAFGLILGSMENEAKPMLDFFDCLHKATIRLINIAIW